MSEPIHWRGFEISPDTDECGAWRLETDDIYLGVAREDDGSFSACVEVLYIEGEGSGATADAALDHALLDVRDGAIRTTAAVDELLARPR